MIDPHSAVSTSTVPRCVACNTTQRVSVHYSALSCHGCKAFFRRTIYERRRYVCKAAGHCVVTDESRNQCRSCRFQRCLNGGMNAKHVREERQQTRRSVDLDTTVLTVALEEHPIIRVLVDLEYALDKGEPQGGPDGVELKRRITMDYNIPDINLRTMDFNSVKIMEDDDLSDAFYRAILTLSEWAGGLEMFGKLCHEDQMVLFRQNFMVFGWLHFAFRTVQLRMVNIGVVAGNGCYLPCKEEEIAKLPSKWQRVMAKITGKVNDMVAVPLAEMDVDGPEFVLLKLMALFLNDIDLTPEGRKVAREMRDMLLNNLIVHIGKRFPEMSSSEKMHRGSKLTLLYPNLMHIGRLEATCLQQLAEETAQNSATQPKPTQGTMNLDDIFADFPMLPSPSSVEEPTVSNSTSLSTPSFKREHSQSWEKCMAQCNLFFSPRV